MHDCTACTLKCLIDRSINSIAGYLPTYRLGRLPCRAMICTSIWIPEPETIETHTGEHQIELQMQRMIYSLKKKEKNWNHAIIISRFIVRTGFFKTERGVCIYAQGIWLIDREERSGNNSKRKKHKRKEERLIQMHGLGRPLLIALPR